MLEGGGDDLVARAQVRAAPALRHEVDRLGRAADEDHLVRAGAEEAGDPRARVLVSRGGLGREPVDAARDGAVPGDVELLDRGEHGERLLRRGGAVEEGKRPLRARERGELGADDLDVVRRKGLERGRRPLHRGSRRPQTASRTVSPCGIQANRNSCSSCRSGSHPDALHQVGGEGVGEQAPRRLDADAARAQVEDRVLVELADGRAVRAAHVVGEDLELGIGVDQRLRGEQQVAAGLLGVGLLRLRVDVDAAVEDAARALVEHALEQLVARGVGLGVVDPHVKVGELAATHQIEAVERHLRAFAGERRLDVVAGDGGAERERLRVRRWRRGRSRGGRGRGGRPRARRAAACSGRRWRPRPPPARSPAPPGRRRPPVRGSSRPPTPRSARRRGSGRGGRRPWAPYLRSSRRAGGAVGRPARPARPRARRRLRRAPWRAPRTAARRCRRSGRARARSAPGPRRARRRAAAARPRRARSRA